MKSTICGLGFSGDDGSGYGSIGGYCSIYLESFFYSSISGFFSDTFSSLIGDAFLLRPFFVLTDSL
jgi:uncharacterized membrane protein